jgi:hypothetical protein
VQSPNKNGLKTDVLRPGKLVAGPGFEPGTFRL